MSKDATQGTKTPRPVYERVIYGRGFPDVPIGDDPGTRKRAPARVAREELEKLRKLRRLLTRDDHKADVVEQSPELQEFTRLQYEARSARRDGGEWASADERAEDLLIRHRHEWEAAFRRDIPRVSEIRFHLGRIAEIVLPARDFLDQANTLLQKYPDVRHVTLQSAKGLLQEVIDHPIGPHLLSLGLQENGLEDADVAPLGTTDRLRGLLWLSLAFNRLTEETLKSLARTTQLSSLRVLLFGGNLAPDPSDDVAYDSLDGAALAVVPTALGRKLEQLAGRTLPWLHPSASYGYLDPPLPEDLW